MGRWMKDLAKEYEELKLYHDGLMDKSREIRIAMHDVLDQMREENEK